MEDEALLLPPPAVSGRPRPGRDMRKATVLAGGAGLCGALASASAKLAVGAELLHAACLRLAAGFGLADSALTCSSVALLVRAVTFGITLLLNAAMWTLFVKSLQFSSSSVQATLTSTASNFLCSAVLGSVLFGEPLAGLWWLGMSLTMAGLALVHSAKPEGTKRAASVATQRTMPGPTARTSPGPPPGMAPGVGLGANPGVVARDGDKNHKHQ